MEHVGLRRACCAEGHRSGGWDERTLVATIFVAALENLILYAAWRIVARTVLSLNQLRGRTGELNHYPDRIQDP
jgi:hypothetical protein